MFDGFTLRPARITRFMEEANEGGGSSTDAGGDTGEEGADSGGADAGDDKSADATDAILKGGTAKSEDNASDDDAAEKTDDDAKDDKSDDAADGDDDTVPEGDYEFAMPEGIELDTAMAEKMSPVLKELGITSKQANALAAAMSEHVSGVAEAMTTDFVGTVTKWTEQAKADKELGGGDDAAWAETVKQSNAALDAVGTPELVQMLAETGVSNHPEMIRLFKRLSISIGSDKFDPDNNPDLSEETAPEENWYGKTTPKSKKG